jgi:hypothetical protein
MPGKTGIIGFYNEHGYRVCQYTDGSVADDLYTAGNASWDSVERVDPKSKYAVSLAQLKKFCEQSSKEYAEETEQEYLGVDYDESEEDEDE